LTVDGRTVRLEVTNLDVGLGKHGPLIVSGVSFQIRAGEILGLVGESGSGKTTVALALSAYTRRGLSIRDGEVRVDGTNLLTLRPSELRAKRGATVAYVPQDPAAALNPALKIGTQLREALTVHHGATEDSDARVLEVLGEVRLEPTREMLRRYPHQLSGGQQQRVALAIAFACRPSLIVLDEPTTGLDVSTQRHVLETVRALCRSYGVAAVYVSHDLAVVSQLVTDVAVMYSGRIIEVGTAQDVLGNPVHPYTRGLVDAVPSLDGTDVLAGIGGQPPRPQSRPAGCAFAPRCAFVFDRCRIEQPAPTMVSGRVVRCHRAAEIIGALGAPSPRARRVTLSPTERSPALVVRDLSASYGSMPVLSNVSLDVEAETCVAIVGESGSGKTTLARCIVGMHDRWTGAISFQGNALAQSARHRPRSVLRQVQYIFQNPYTSLNPRKTIGQVLSQPLEHAFSLSSPERHRRITQVLEDVSLASDFLARYPDELSGGERQRVAIARALIVEPDLLVCDEVTSALDVSVQAVIVELLRTLQRERRLSMIFITHNVALVRSIAQSAVVLFEGRMVEVGSVDDILERPTDPYAVRLMEDVPTLGWRTGDMSPGIAQP
jgi:peptide/nickel transport system ATP-binding protein